MLKQTKHFILLLSFLSLCFISCKKDNGNDDIDIGTITADVDGVATSFNHSAKATVLNVSGGYGISIQGYKKDLSESQTNWTFSIARPTPITTGTYIENSGSNPLVRMTYTYDFLAGILYTSEAYGSSAHPVTITITDISSTSVKGTFSGELYCTSGPAGTPYKNVFSNGSFNVSF